MSRPLKMKSKDLSERRGYSDASRRKCVWLFKLFLLLTPFFAGGFFEWSSCFFSIVLMGYLFYFQRKMGRIIIRKNFTFCMVTVLVIFYGISIFWAVDRGMAFVGFCKFLPLILFALAVMQFSVEERKSFLDTIPVSGAVMSVLSVILGQIPLLRELFFVNGRLAGFFMYTNAFAAFLLAGVIVLVGKKELGKRNGLKLFILLTGIVLSGSRTVFFLLAATMLTFVILLKGRMRWVIGLSMVIVVAVTILYAGLTKNVQSVGRYLTTSLSDSTFLGRILYFRDALPVIIKHPFGLGYKGYFYTQGSFQTGVYSVLNVHNELLQLFLDVGFLPACLFMIAAIRSFLKKDVDLIKRMILAVMTAHAMFDFDFQFISNWFVLLLVLDLDSGADIVIKRYGILRCAGGILTGICIWVGAASCFFHFGNDRAAVKVYAGYTDAWVSMLSKLENADEMEMIADEIVLRNQSVSLAYSAKARAAYARGDFDKVIFYKKKAIALSQYELDEYLDYFEMLYVGVQLYEASGDSASAGICVQQIKEIPNMLARVLEKTNAYAWVIRDKPDLTLPDEYQEILEGLSEKNNP